MKIYKKGLILLVAKVVKDKTNHLLNHFHNSQCFSLFQCFPVFWGHQGLLEIWEYKLIEKKERVKRFIKSWHPISLLNVDYKMIAKSIATRLKETLPELISFQQMAYVKNRFTGEGGRLISDILGISESLNLKSYIVTVDIEKTFDFLSPFFFTCFS